MTWGPGPGDLSVGGQNAENAEHIKKLDRGQHDGFVLGDDLVQDVTITAEFENIELTHAVNERLLDFIKRQGSFAAAQSVDDCIWAFKVIVTMDDGVITTTITMPIVEGEGAFAEAKEGHTLSFAGRNHGNIIEA
jgi:hypothetical protein